MKIDWDAIVQETIVTSKIYLDDAEDSDIDTVVEMLLEAKTKLLKSGFEQVFVNFDMEEAVLIGVRPRSKDEVQAAKDEQRSELRQRLELLQKQSANIQQKLDELYNE